MTSLYEHLGLTKEASDDDIKKAFKKSALKYHPDKNKDPNAQEEFKKIADAYGVLSDPQKRQKYDDFGIVDDDTGGGGFSSMNINDIFANIFGGGGMPFGGGMPGGAHSFVFMDGMGRGMPGMHAGMHGVKNADVVPIDVTSHDIKYGNQKKVEYEVLDQCNNCKGTGAADPDSVVNCMTCNGKGIVNHQLGPFFVTQAMCHSCSGNGNIIKNNKLCQSCKGEKLVYVKKQINVTISKGLSNGLKHVVEGKGGYNNKTRSYNDLVLKFTYKLPDNMRIDENGHVDYILDVALPDLLCGFSKTVSLYNEDFQVVSTGYINPKKHFLFKGQGVTQGKKPCGNLTVKINVTYCDDETKMNKYNDVFLKVFKKSAVNIESISDKTLCLS